MRSNFFTKEDLKISEVRKGVTILSILLEIRILDKIRLPQHSQQREEVSEKIGISDRNAKPEMAENTGKKGTAKELVPGEQTKRIAMEIGQNLKD